MTLVFFTVPGKPQGKARPRFTRFGKPYTARKTRAYEETIGWAAKAAMKGRKLLSGPLAVTVTAAFVKAQSTKNTWPTGKPDIDNIGKAVLDGLNKIVYADDCQVVNLFVGKVYAPTAYLAISVREWP